MKLLGIDYGTKRIGIAVSDDGGTIAFPDQVIENDARVLQIITLIATEKEVGAIIIGESKDYKMQDNLLMEEVRDFAQALATQVSVPIEFHSEMMTSMQAAKTAEHMAGRHKEGRNASRQAAPVRGTVDAQAAAIMLQDYIDGRKD